MEEQDAIKDFATQRDTNTRHAKLSIVTTRAGILIGIACSRLEQRRWKRRGMNGLHLCVSRNTWAQGISRRQLIHMKFLSSGAVSTVFALPCVAHRLFPCGCTLWSIGGIGACPQCMCCPEARVIGYIVRIHQFLIRQRVHILVALVDSL